MGADMKGRLFTAALFCTAIALGCAGNPKEPSVEPSGFLGDYSQLAPGREGQARLIYFNPEADFSLYDKMLIAPVALWDPKRSAPIASPTPEQSRLVARLQRALTEQLEGEFRLVDAALPGTLSLRMAITPAQGTRIGIEAELVDATTNARLIGAVDDQDVALSADAADPFGAALDRWAELVRMRLVALRNFDTVQKAIDSDASP